MLFSCFLILGMSAFRLVPIVHIQTHSHHPSTLEPSCPTLRCRSRRRSAPGTSLGLRNRRVNWRACTPRPTVLKPRCAPSGVWFGSHPHNGTRKRLHTPCVHTRARSYACTHAWVDMCARWCAEFFAHLLPPPLWLYVEYSSGP